MNEVQRTRRKPIAELYGYFKTFPVKILTSATDALHAIRQRPFMIGNRSKELRLNLGSVVSVTPGLNATGVEVLKYCTKTCSPTSLDTSRSGLAVSRLASSNDQARRRYRDGNIDVGGHPFVRQIEQVGWRFLCLRSGPRHPGPSSESSVSR